MKILMPVLSRFARHGGVTQFIGNFLSAVRMSKPNVAIYDHECEITNKLIEVNAFGRWTGLKRKCWLFACVVAYPYKLAKFDHVFLNPSLGKSSMAREMFYAKHCVKRNKKFSIFFHGWNWDFAEHLDANTILRTKYIRFINEASNVFVLGAAFRSKLIEWGVNENKIHLENTMISENFVPKHIAKGFDESKLKILFMARITRSKGIFEAVDAFKIHLSTYPQSELSIAGDGEDLIALKAYVKKLKIKNINFVGFADEIMKRELLETHDVFILPSYSEGMPISIFEAMAYGLTIITRPVGGIPDYFKNNEMGFLVESLLPEDLSGALDKVIGDGNLRARVSQFNNNFIIENVTSEIVVGRMLSKIEYSNE